MQYKLDIARDVDHDGHPDDEDCGYILNLPHGWQFADSNYSSLGWKGSAGGHSKGFDSMKDLRDEVKNNVCACDCGKCEEGIASK